MVANAETARNSTAAREPVSGKQLIDSLREQDGGLDQAAILRIIPYQDPFLFLDRISSLDEESVEGSFTVPPEMAFLRGHFTHVPVMPGALMAEGVGQAASILVRYHLEDTNKKDIMICRLEDARFMSPAVPGSTLTYRARLGKLNRRLARIEGDVLQGDKTLAAFQMAMAIVDRDQLIASCQENS